MHFNHYSRRKTYNIDNVTKYGGDHYEVVVKSNLELDFCRWLDTNENVTYWLYEPFSIKYYNPLRKKYSKYTPDFHIIYGSYVKKNSIIEVKSHSNIEIEYVEDIEILTESELFYYKRYQDFSILNNWKFLTMIDFLNQKDFDFYVYTEKGFFQPVFNSFQDINIIVNNNIH